MHNLGLIGGWGYVEGGMGRVSFAIADAAVDAGAVLACGVAGGRHRARRGRPARRAVTDPAAVVVSNADPHRTLALLDAGDPAAAPAAWRAGRGLGRAQPGRQAQLRAAPPAPLHAPPAPTRWVYRSMVVLSTGIDDTQAGVRGGRPGRAVARLVRAVLPDRPRPERRPARAGTP